VPDLPFTALQIADPTLTEALATDREPRWAMFLGYWQSLADELQRIPSRGDIDPSNIPGALLPHIFLVDVIRQTTASPRLQFRYRLLGGVITHIEKARPGDILDEICKTDNLLAIEDHYIDAMQGRIRIRSTTLEWESPDRNYINYQVAVLPLADSTGEITNLMGCSIYEMSAQRIY